MLPVLLLLALATPLAAPASGQGRRPKPDVYRRAVARAVERAQAELSSRVDFALDHSSWSNPWVVTSEHYEVRTTHSYLQGVELARNLEFMHAEFVKLLGEGREHAGPRRVWIFPTMGAYNTFGDEVAGDHSSILGSFFASGHAEQPVATYQNGNRTWLGMWITHSALHQYVEQSFGTQSVLWVDEGLASYFSLFWDWAYAARELERIRKGSTFVPLLRLVRDPIEAYRVAPDDRFIELGMLFHFLLNSCEATKNGAAGDPTTGPFQDFLRAAVRGQDVSASEFAQTFEDASALLEQDFKAFDFANR